MDDKEKKDWSRALAEMDQQYLSYAHNNVYYYTFISFTRKWKIKHINVLIKSKLA